MQVEAVADIARSITAMELGCRFSDPKNIAIRNMLLRKAPEIAEFLWRHRMVSSWTVYLPIELYHDNWSLIQVFYVYEDEQIDEKSSPARMHVRRYVTIMLKLGNSEAAEPEA